MNKIMWSKFCFISACPNTVVIQFVYKAIIEIGGGWNRNEMECDTLPTVRVRAFLFYSWIPVSAGLDTAQFFSFSLSFSVSATHDRSIKVSWQCSICICSEESGRAQFVRIGYVTIPAAFHKLWVHLLQCYSSFII